MTDLIKIGDVEVDFDSPCEVARALRKVELQVTTTGAVVRTKFGDDDVQWSQANLGRLRDLIDDYERKCAAASGTRTRYAKRLRFC